MITTLVVIGNLSSVCVEEYLVFPAHLPYILYRLLHPYLIIHVHYTHLHVQKLAYYCSLHFCFKLQNKKVSSNYKY